MDIHTIASILNSIGADQVKIVSNNKLRCCCPLAFWTHPKGRDNNPSMAVVADGGKGIPAYVCLSCHEKGSLRDMLLFLTTRGYFDFLKWVEVIDGESSAESVDNTKSKKLFDGLKQASVIHADPCGIRWRKGEGKFRETNKAFYDYKAVLEEEEKIEEIPYSVYEPYSGSVPRYALDRGISIETCKEWDLGHDKRMKRLLFPIRDRKNRLVAISGRVYVDDCPKCGGKWITLCENCGFPEEDHVVDGDEKKCIDGLTYAATRACCSRCGMMKQPKYLHSKGFPRRVVLYGEHRKEEAVDGRVYVVEGHIDMIKMWQAGYRPVVAMLGSHPSPLQVEKLIRSWQRVIIVPDGNQAGVDMGLRIKKMIADRTIVTIKNMEEGCDPGGSTEEELRELLGRVPVMKAA